MRALGNGSLNSEPCLTHAKKGTVVNKCLRMFTSSVEVFIDKINLRIYLHANY